MNFSKSMILAGLAIPKTVFGIHRRTFFCISSAMFIFLLLFAGCPGQNPVQSNNATAQNNTSVSYADALQTGDSAMVDYILVITNSSRADPNQVYDTSLPGLANASGIYNPQRRYAPLNVTLNDSNGLLPAFTRQLVGMKAGENKTFIIDPGEGYGYYESSRVFTLPLVYNASRSEQIPLSYLLERNITPTVGKSIYTMYWPANVTGISNGNVTVKYMPELNITIFFNGLPERVVSFDEGNITMELVVQQGVVYGLQTPSGQAINALATEVTGSNATFDANGPLAGRELNFTVFVRSIRKAASPIGAK